MRVLTQLTSPPNGMFDLFVYVNNRPPTRSNAPPRTGRRRRAAQPKSLDIAWGREGGDVCERQR